MNDELRHETIHSGAVKLHCVVAGSGPPIVLLHGFPEFWYSWRHQIPFLARAGFTVYAPDLRGYNDSDKPRSVSAYRMARLIEDVDAILDYAGAQRAIIGGHDWG